MKNCELCKFPARMYCESDEASLCWDCDAKVHGANFLVARHTRSLLCHVCQSPTPWKASGSTLGPTTVSVCVGCADGREEEEESEGGYHVQMDGQDEIDESDDDNEEEEVCVDDDDDGDYQVVPWLSTPPPPPVASSSSSEDSSSCDADRDISDSETVFSLKRKHESALDRRLQDGLGCSSSQRRHGSTLAGMAAETKGDVGASCVDSLTRPLKGRKIEAGLSGICGDHRDA